VDAHVFLDLRVVATVTTIPALILPNRPVQLAFTATDGGNYVKVWCRSAPRGSKLRNTLDKDQSERVIVISESDITKRPQYTFDVGGSYLLEVEEFQKGAENYGGRYRGDPDGFRTEDRVAVASATLSVCSRLEAEVGVSPDTCTLQLYVSDILIVPTSGTIHGVTTPALLRPTTDKARAAADSADVVEALAGLANQAGSTIAGDLGANISSWITKFNGHIADATFHANADTDNTVAAAYRSPQTIKSVARSLAECVKKYTQHIQNIDPAASSPDPGSASYHEDGGDPVTDWVNTLVASGGSTIGACQILFADLHRCLTAHLLNDDVHTSADTLHTPIVLTSALANLHKAFLGEIAALSPTVPDNEHTAKVRLVSGAGFKEA
jgi:hypothetical protein